MACKCGNNEFICNFRSSGDCIIDGNGNWVRDVQIENSKFEGPYVCTVCHERYPTLPNHKRSDKHFHIN